MTADTIACLKITLDDVKPAVLRRLEAPLGIRLDRLHLTIQAAMGWTNSHLYELRAGDVGWSTPYPDADWYGDFLGARKVERLADAEPGILKDPKHERHAELLEWIGEDFDPNADHADQLIAAVDALAKT